MALEIDDNERSNMLSNDANQDYQTFEPPDNSFCGRIKFLFSPFQINESTDGKVRILVILPETYYLYALLSFWFFFVVCLVVTLTLSPEYDPKKNPIVQRDGYNLFCIYWDYPPSSYQSNTTILPLIIFWLLFIVFDVGRAYCAYFKNGIITQRAYVAYKWLSILTVVCFVSLTVSLSVDPFTSLVAHTIPYLMLIFGLWLTNALQVYFYQKINAFEQYEQWKTFKVCKIIYIVLLTLVILYKMIWSTANLIGMENENLSFLHWSKLYPQILPFGLFVERLFLVLVAILPVPMKIWIAPQLRDHCVRIELNFEVKHNDNGKSV